MNNTFDLFYDEYLVGRIQGAFEHQGTWFGTFEGYGMGVPPRVHEFILFCRDWHRRIDEDPKKETDPAEFDQFHDVLALHQWTVRQTGARQLVHQAPMFTDETEICWVLESRASNASSI
jgi:hypothetical protein